MVFVNAEGRRPKSWRCKNQNLRPPKTAVDLLLFCGTATRIGVAKCCQTISGPGRPKTFHPVLLAM